MLVLVAHQVVNRCGDHQKEGYCAENDPADQVGIVWMCHFALLRFVRFSNFSIADPVSGLGSRLVAPQEQLQIPAWPRTDITSQR